MHRIVHIACRAVLATALLTLSPAHNDVAYATDVTAFVTSSIIKSSDSSACTVSAANPSKLNGTWLFDASCDGGANSFKIKVGGGFTESEASSTAKKYGNDVGRLPKVLRPGIRSLNIFSRDSRWYYDLKGGLHISTGFGEKAYHEEIMLHEATHASLDHRVKSDPDWQAAQVADGTYISDYARARPQLEDVAESFVAYFAARFVPARISGNWKRRILKTIPNRVAYFDALLSAGDMQPFTAAPLEVSIARGAKAVVEGAPATFTLTALPRPSKAIPVNVRVTETGGFAAPGTRSVTISADGGATLSVATTNDGVDGKKGSVTAEVMPGSGYIVGGAPVNAAKVEVIEDQGPLPTVAIVAKAASVTEGGKALFAVTRRFSSTQGSQSLLATALKVTLEVSEAAGGDFVAADDEGTTSVTIPAGEATAVFEVATTGDGVHEPDGSVTATLGAGNGYTISTTAVAAVVAVSDDDGPVPVTVSKSSLSLTEGGATAAYTVALDSDPGATVSIAVASGDTGAVTVAPATLTFTPGGDTIWNKPQTVTATAVQDTDASNERVAITHTATVTGDSSNPYHGIDVAGVTASVEDDDAATLTVSLGLGRTGLIQPRGREYSLPGPGFVVNLSAAHGSPIWFKACLTSPQNLSGVLWTRGKAGPLDGDGCFTDHIANSARQDYFLSRANVADDQSAEITVRLLEDPNNPLPAGIALAQSPVTVTMLDDDPTYVYLQRQDGNSNHRTGKGDPVGEAAGAATLKLSINDRYVAPNRNYASRQALTAGERLDVPLVISGAGITPADYRLELTSGAGATLLGSTTLTPVVTMEGEGAGVAYLKLTAVDDGDDEGALETLRVSLGPNGGSHGFDGRTFATNLDGGAKRDPGGHGVFADIAITDNDGAAVGVKVSKPSLSVNAGAEATYTLVLDSEPAGNVTISMESDDDHVIVSPSSVTFSTSGDTIWNKPRTVTVTGVAAGGANIEHKITTGDGADYTTAIIIDPVEVKVMVAAVPEIAISGPTQVYEGDDIAFTLTLSPPQTSITSVKVRYTDDDSGDFLAGIREGDQIHAIPANATELTVKIPTRSNVARLDGMVTAAIQPRPGIYAVSPTEHSAEVKVDDAPPVLAELSAASDALSEGDTREVSLTISRTLADDETLAVRITNTGGATRGTDYNLACPNPLPAGVTCNRLDTPTGTVTFTGGTTTSVTLTLTATVDGLTESGPNAEVDDQSVDLGIGALASTRVRGGVTVTDSAGAIELLDPAAVKLTVDDDNPTEAGNVVVTVTLFEAAHAAPKTVAIPLVCTAGTAEAADFACPASVSIVKGATKGTATVTTTDDSDAEGDETFTLGLGDLPPGYFPVSGWPSSLTVTIDDDDTSAIPADLIASVRALAGQVHHGQAHVDRWKRVLMAFGEETYEGLTPMTAAEAKANAEKYSSPLWPRIAAVLEKLEAHAAETVPEVTLAAGSAVTEGGDAVFTLTASPAPSAALAVSVAVAADGDYGIAGGDRTVSIPTTGSATLTLATTDDGADESDGSVTATLAAGDGYTVGSAASGSVAVADNDATTVTLSVPDATATEGDATDTASLVLTLGRGLAAGESLAVPLSFSGGAAGTDFTLALESPAPAGVTFSGTVVTFTGPSSGLTATAAEVLLTASDDADEADGSVTASIPASSTGSAPTLTATGLGGGATGTRTGGGAIALTDDDATQEETVAIPADLIAAVRDLAGQTHHGQAHVNRWKRVLMAFGLESYPGLTATTAAEAKANADKYSSPLWPEIAKILAVLEGAVEPEPEVTIAAGNAVTEGGDAVFTLTASPAPASSLPVSVTVSASGDWGVSAGSRTMCTKPCSRRPTPADRIR